MNEWQKNKKLQKVERKLNTSTLNLLDAYFGLTMVMDDATKTTNNLIMALNKHRTESPMK